MPDKRRYRTWLTLAVVSALALAGALLTFTAERKQAAHTGTRPADDVPIPIRIYTNPGATTPQIPLWAALQSPAIRRRFTPETQVWKTAAHLQSILLGGEGDVWIGHLDGFARARARGAPVALLAVTGWRKFALVSRDPEIRGFTQFNGRSLAYAPTGCPSVDILTAVLGDAISQVEFVPHEPKQLALKMVQGKVDSALLPEPLVTVLLDKVPEARVVTNVEDVYARLNDGNPRMPIAGIAVHDDLVRHHPEALIALRQAILQAGSELAGNPDAAVKVLPDAFAEFVPPRIVRASLARDVILARSAHDVAAEIRRYLRIVTPELFADGGDLPKGFIVDASPASKEE